LIPFLLDGEPVEPVKAKKELGFGAKPHQADQFGKQPDIQINFYFFLSFVLG
jgi:hypothetical protein